MLLSLEQILTVVAKDKQVKNPEEWVNNKLNHCELHSDYCNFVHLRSNRRMWFGVKDSKFDCKDFILYREYRNNDLVDTIKEFEIFTFRTLNDISRVDRFFKEAYQHNYDTMSDVRLYFQTTPVNFKLIMADGGLAKLGRYNDLDDGYRIETDIYEVSFNDGVMPTIYCRTEEQLKLTLYNLREIISEVKVTKCGKDIDFKLTKASGEWVVEL